MLVSISTNEVFTINNSCWVGICARVLDKCKQMPILLTLENMTQVLLHVFLSFGIWMFK